MRDCIHYAGQCSFNVSTQGRRKFEAGRVRV
jgi:hypothetical protein